MTDLSTLRAVLVSVAAGQCEWPYCDQPGEVMSHLHHRGMGGSEKANVLSNVALLCDLHDDVLDGRTDLGVLRFELNWTLSAHLQRTRSAYLTS